MNAEQIFPDTEILSRVIAPQEGGLSVDVADALLRLSFPAADVERMNELAEKNRVDQLNDIELSELQGYLRVGSLLNLLQSKARCSIKHG
jgi:hypothetical protein